MKYEITGFELSKCGRYLDASVKCEDGKDRRYTKSLPWSATTPEKYAEAVADMRKTVEVVLGPQQP